MTSSNASYRQILQASSIVGISSGVNIVLGVVRNKLIAVWLGPSGIGLIGLLSSLMATASAIAGLGVGQVGTRQVAEAQASGNPVAIASTHRALFLATMALAVLGGAIVVVCGQPIAYWILSKPELGTQVSWLGLGVALSVAASAQAALLTGLRRITDLASIGVLGGVISTLLGLVAIWNLGERGVLLFLLAAPLANFVVGLAVVRRLPKSPRPKMPWHTLVEQWRTLARLGLAFMLAGLASTGAQLVVRALVQNQLSLAELGQFQAAWTVSMTYIGFVLGALGTDFYPRLTGVISDPDSANRLVNEQTQVALLIAAPVLLATLALAPWVVTWLYSSDFAPAASVLRWQVLGDVLKLASWPIGFILLAAGDGRSFLIAEASGMTVFVLVTIIALPSMGINATGIAFLAMYVFLLPLVYWRARRQTGFRWQPAVRRQILVLALSATLVAVVASRFQIAGMLLGLSLSLLAALIALDRLTAMADLRGPLGAIGAACRRLLGNRSR